MGTPRMSCWFVSVTLVTGRENTRLSSQSCKDSDTKEKTNKHTCSILTPRNRTRRRHGGQDQGMQLNCTLDAHQYDTKKGQRICSAVWRLAGRSAIVPFVAVTSLCGAASMG
ncbi:hypothetical protein MRB53_041043 [Persea americana]|nr:hypothetical protein MRB53_041043 [Persea americana]